MPDQTDALLTQLVELQKQRAGLRLIYLLLAVAFIAILGPYLYSWFRYLSLR